MMDESKYGNNISRISPENLRKLRMTQSQELSVHN